MPWWFTSTHFVVVRKVLAGHVVVGAHQGILACLHANWVFMYCMLCFHQLHQGQLLRNDLLLHVGCDVQPSAVYAGTQQLLMLHYVYPGAFQQHLKYDRSVHPFVSNTG